MSKFKPTTIKTERLTLASISECSINDMCDIFENKEVALTYMLPIFECREDMEKLARRLIELSNDGERFVYGVYLDKKFIGFVNDVEIANSAIELGYVINPKFKNNGYATEALMASIKTLLDMGFNEVKTGAFIENLASFRVMEKAGMSKSDYTDQISYNGKMHTCAYYHMRAK
ncbi:MAG: GNAT family N-acetyltransferase [Clostridia bacterium]|nr:GNAT family N-acetyltransferase [Clostridia bacterium]